MSVMNILLTNTSQTDEEAVVRILGSHDKNELLLIAEHYLETYGETLTELLKSELSGHLETAAVKWVSVLDPLDLHALKSALAIKAQVTSKPAYVPCVKALDPSATLKIKSGQHTTIDTNTISELRLGLGWSTNGEAIDLDAGCILLDSNGYITDTVYFGNKSTQGIEYGGDNRSGDAKVQHACTHSTTVCGVHVCNTCEYYMCALADPKIKQKTVDTVLSINVIANTAIDIHNVVYDAITHTGRR